MWGGTQIYRGTGTASDAVTKTYVIGFKPKHIDFTFTSEGNFRATAMYLNNDGTDEFKLTYFNGADYTSNCELVINDVGFTFKQSFTGSTLDVNFIAFG